MAKTSRRPRPPHPVLTPLSAADGEHLVRLASAAARERGFPMTYDGHGVLVDPSGMKAGLGNLARDLAGIPRRQWPAAVAEHFDLLARLDHQVRRPAGPGATVYLRLIAADGLPDEAEPLWEFVPGVAVVAATRADGATVMHFDPPASLGLSRDEVTEVGLRNLRRLADRVSVATRDGVRVAVLEGSMLTGSRALVLDTVLRESLHVENPSHGVLLAMPCRDVLYVHVVEDDGVLDALGLLASMAPVEFGKSRGPISPFVYFAHDGAWEQVTREIGGALRITPRPRFLAALRSVT